MPRLSGERTLIMGFKARSYHRWINKSSRLRVCDHCGLQECIEKGPSGGTVPVYYVAGAKPGVDDPASSWQAPRCPKKKAA